MPFTTQIPDGFRQQTVRFVSQEVRFGDRAGLWPKTATGDEESLLVFFYAIVGHLSPGKMDVIEFFLEDLTILQVRPVHFSFFPIEYLMSVIVRGKFFRGNAEIGPGEAYPAEGDVSTIP